MVACCQGLSGGPLLACRLQEVQEVQGVQGVQGVQEVQEERSRSSGSQLDLGGASLPATVDCELREDLVGTCCPGELLRVRGILQVMDANLAASGPGQSVAPFSLRPQACCKPSLHANAVSLLQRGC